MNKNDMLLGGFEEVAETVLSNVAINDSFFPSVTTDSLDRFEDGVLEAFRHMEKDEKEEEARLVSIHPNSPQYFPLLADLRGSEVTQIPIARNVNKLKNVLVDDGGNIICNFHILDDRRLIQKPSGGVEIEFVVADENGTEYDFCLPVEVFREGGWYKGVFGLSCPNSRLFRIYLETICGKTINEIVTKVPSEGWYRDESEQIFHFYTHCGPVLSKSEVRIEFESTEIYPCVEYSEHELAKKFWNMRLLTNSDAALVVLTYVVLASMYSLFNYAGFTPTFILGLIGPRSSRKTSLAMVMANLFCRKPGATPSITFRTSTHAGIEQMLRKFKDAVMVIDDLMPSSDRATKRKVETNLEHVIRLFGDSIGTTRNTDFFSKEIAERVDYKTGGLCLLTGEYFSGVASSRSRCVILTLGKDTVNNEILTFYQDNLDILPGFLWNFLGYVEKKQNDILNFITAYVKERRSELSRDYSVARFPEYQSQLEAAFAILFEYFIQVDVLTIDEINVETQHFSQLLKRLLHENEMSMEQSDPIEQVKKVISVCYTETPEIVSNLDEDIVQKSEFYENDKCFFVYPRWLFGFINLYFNSCGQSSAILDVSFLKTILNRSGFLVCKKEGSVLRKTMKLPNHVKIGDHRRFLCISKSILETKCF